MVGNFNKVYIAHVHSGETAHLVFSIISVLLIAFIETVMVMMFKNLDVYTAVFVGFLFQGAVLVVGYLGAYMYNCFKKSSKFSIFFSKKEDVANLESLESEYHICQSDDNGVIFIRKEDVDKYEDRNLIINYKNTKIAERKLFEKKVC